MSARRLSKKNVSSTKQKNDAWCSFLLYLFWLKTAGAFRNLHFIVGQVQVQCLRWKRFPELIVVQHFIVILVCQHKDLLAQLNKFGIFFSCLFLQGLYLKKGRKKTKAHTHTQSQPCNVSKTVVVKYPLHWVYLTVKNHGLHAGVRVFVLECALTAVDWLCDAYARDRKRDLSAERAAARVAQCKHHKSSRIQWQQWIIITKERRDERENIHQATFCVGGWATRRDGDATILQKAWI